MSWYDYIPSPALQLGNLLSGGTPMGVSGSDITGAISGAFKDPADKYRQGIVGIGNEAAGFGRQNAQNYQGNQAGINQSIQALRDQAAGKNSVSAEQLRQGLQQNLAAQRSMAASASPQNAVMAARTAANNMARQGYGMSGQQALAGLQERNQAQQALGQLQLGQSGQNMQGALGGYGAASQNYAAALGNPGQSDAAKYGPAILGALTAISDRRLKTDVKDADEDAKRMLDGLKAYSFKYKDDKYGKGDQFGVMAQDLEESGLKHAVIDTPIGKVVDGAKAATSALGMVGALGRRVSELEAKRKK